MTTENLKPAAAAGTLMLGGDLPVNRIGFGTMRLTGPGIWGEPPDREQAIAVLRRAVELGVNFVDTAAYYGLGVTNRLIVEALYPYPPELVIVSKFGARREADKSWHPALSPAELRQACEDNLRQLRLERLDLVHLRHVEGTQTPFMESLQTMAELQREGKIRHIGISNIPAEQLAEAQQLVPIASVQNMYNIQNRQGQDVLDICTRQGIVFEPFFPLVMGQVGQEQPGLANLAAKYGVSASQIALAWLLAVSPQMLIIPGTSSLKHLEENIAVGNLQLSAEDLATLNG